ncbi:MAG: hypothetical protein LQ349_007782 [Xanthoria aureola]|nr:MAG: hypothetical protein LQ349_007782 [Xanthoria aureola]
MAALRAFSAFLAVLLCGLLLSTFHLPEKKSGTSVNVVNSQQIESPTLVSTVQQRVALPFGRQSIAANASFSETQGTRIKRATPFEAAKEKGAQYLTAYQSAFECDRTPGPVFTEDQFKNAWKDEPLNGDFVDEDWQTALGIPARPPNYVATKHSQTVAPFVSATGQNVKDETGGSYKLQYIPSTGAIIVLGAYSPDFIVGTEGIAKIDRPAVIPQLNRLSDMMWYRWNSLVTDPATLRFIGHDNISNRLSQNIIREILLRTTGDRFSPWPGNSLGLNTDDGKALLGTPNGIGVAWLLLDRYRDMGKREPTVTIWEGKEGTMMLWDLKPV